MIESVWFGHYKAAGLETDRTKVLTRIELAESAIHERQRRLSENHEGTAAEKEAMADALSGLKALREDVAQWRKPRN